MNTPKEIAQWVINNRYPKNENDKVSDFEMYNQIVDAINKLKVTNTIIEKKQDKFSLMLNENWSDVCGVCCMLRRNCNC